MPTPAAAAADLLANPRPVLCLDTCELLMALQCLVQRRLVVTLHEGECDTRSGDWGPCTADAPPVSDEAGETRIVGDRGDGMVGRVEVEAAYFLWGQLLKEPFRTFARGEPLLLQLP